MSTGGRISRMVVGMAWILQRNQSTKIIMYPSRAPPPIMHAVLRLNGVPAARSTDVKAG